MVLEKTSMAGKRVILTGAGRGLGRQMALALARAGADIACVARTKSQIEESADEIRSLGREALAVQADVAKSDQINDMVAEVLGHWGRVDVFIANAGGGGASAMKDVAAISDEDWYDSIDINLSSAFFSARAIVPHFREQGGGVIINVGSGSGLRGDPRLLGYGSAKAGVVGLTMILATQLVKDNIRVNCIIPGFVMQKPPETEAEHEWAKGRGKFIPTGRIGQATDLGPLALYLASDVSSYVTGECFYIDGGGLAGGLAPTGWDVRSGSIAGRRVMTSQLQPGFDLTGRRALVCGSSSAAVAIAAAFREAGASVTLAGPIAAGGDMVVLNPANGEEVQRKVGDIAKRLGGLDIAVVTTDTYLAAPIGKTTDSDLANVLSANLAGAYNVFRSASTAMAQGGGGRLIAVVPGVALRGLAHLSALAAASSGVVGLVKALSQELGPSGITTNAIATGWLSETPGRGPDSADANQLLRYIPQRRFGDPDDVAALAVYLASEASGFVNGAVMAIDGGVFKHL